MTQPPNAPGPYGPQNSGWQQQPNPNYPPGPVAPGPGGPGYGGRPPRRTGLYVVIAVVVVLVLGGAGVLVATISGGDDNQSGPTQPSTASPPPTASSEPNPLPSSTATSSEPSAPRLTEATALATRFLAYVNAADQKHALALGCADSRNILAGLLVFMIDPPTKLTVSGQPVATQTYYRKISVPYSGTTKGPVPRTGTVDIMDQPSTPLCVRLTTMR